MAIDARAERVRWHDTIRRTRSIDHNRGCGAALSESSDWLSEQEERNDKNFCEPLQAKRVRSPTVGGGDDEFGGESDCTTLSSAARLALERSVGTVNCVSFVATASLFTSSVPLSKLTYLMLVPLIRLVASALAKFSRAIIAPLESHCSARSE